MQKVLTDRYVASIKPVPGKRVTVFDTRTPGLCVRVTETGHRRFYVIARQPDRKQKWAEIRDGNASVTLIAWLWAGAELKAASLPRIEDGTQIHAPGEG